MTRIVAFFQIYIPPAQAKSFTDPQPSFQQKPPNRSIGAVLCFGQECLAFLPCPCLHLTRLNAGWLYSVCWIECDIAKVNGHGKRLLDTRVALSHHVRRGIGQYATGVYPRSTWGDDRGVQQGYQPPVAAFLGSPEAEAFIDQPWRVGRVPCLLLFPNGSFATAPDASAQPIVLPLECFSDAKSLRGDLDDLVMGRIWPGSL